MLSSAGFEFESPNRSKRITDETPSLSIPFSFASASSSASPPALPQSVQDNSVVLLADVCSRRLDWKTKYVNMQLANRNMRASYERAVKIHKQLQLKQILLSAAGNRSNPAVIKAVIEKRIQCVSDPNAKLHWSHVLKAINNQHV